MIKMLVVRSLAKCGNPKTEPSPTLFLFSPTSSSFSMLSWLPRCCCCFFLLFLLFLFLYLRLRIMSRSQRATCLCASNNNGRRQQQQQQQRQQQQQHQQHCECQSTRRWPSLLPAAFCATSTHTHIHTLTHVLSDVVVDNGSNVVAPAAVVAATCRGLAHQLDLLAHKI